MRRLPALVLVLVLAGAPAVGAQEAEEELAGYVGTASGAAFSLQPIFPGLLPTGDAPVEVTGALSAANVKSGGNAYAQAAPVWPGSAAANMGPLIGTAAGQPLFTELVPPYPAGVDANQDEGVQEQGAAPGPVMRAEGEPGSSNATSSATGAAIPAVFNADSVSSISRAVVEGGQLITETTVTLNGVAIAEGVVTIDSIKSVARATSDGNKGTSTGSTVVSGLAIAGQAAEITEEGISSNGLPVEVLQTALDGAGITMELTKGAGGAKGGAADRVSAGLVVTIDNPAAAANPQFVGSRFVLSLAPTAVGALASPPFDFEFNDEFPVAAVDSGGEGFSTIAGSVTDTFSSEGSAGNGATTTAGAPLAMEPTGNRLVSVGGVSTGMLLAMLAALYFGTKRVHRYVAQFVTTEEP